MVKVLIAVVVIVAVLVIIMILVLVIILVIVAVLVFIVVLILIAASNYCLLYYHTSSSHFLPILNRFNICKTNLY